MSSPYDLIDQSRVRDSTKVLWANRLVIVISAVAAGTLAAVISLILPPTYEAVATCIPVTTQAGLSGLAQLGFSADDFGFPLGLGRNPTAVYPEVVRSRRTLGSLLRTTFPTAQGDSVLLLTYLEEHGSGPKQIDRAIKRLRGAIGVNVDRRSGLLSIRVQLGDPVVAAGVANTAAELLQYFMISSFSSQAGENRRFIESRLAESEMALSEAEGKLRSFRERNLRIGNSPHLLLEQDRLTRALREQEEVYLSLKRQCELAKIQERRDVPIINPLDRAEAPAIRSSPKRTFMACSGLIFGGLIGVGLVLYRQQG